MRSALLLISLCVFVGLVRGYGEPDATTGGPSWQERANHFFVNAVRISPSQYKSIYMNGFSPSPASILGSTYPAVKPVYMENKLVESAEAHSNDMTAHNCFQHNSCDGTDIWTRIGSYYTCSGTKGENIAAGSPDPLATNNQWLCDQSGSACAADGSGSDGHRSNIMDVDYKAIGVGFSSKSGTTYTNYWTQDFGGSTCAPNPTNSIYSGSHYIPTTPNGNTKFISIFSSGSAPSSQSVVVAGTSYALTLELGSAATGAYVTTIPSGSGCRSYYFTFVAGGTTFRYPDTGCLVTYKEGSCTTTFDASCSGGTVASSSAAAATTATTAAVASTSTSAKASTSTTATTAAAVTTSTTTAAATTGSTTGTPPTNYYIYTTSLQNSWFTVVSSGTTVNPSTTYLSKSCLSAVVPASGYFQFSHTAAVSTSGYGYLKWSMVASVSGSVGVTCNGVTATLTAGTGWTNWYAPLSLFNNPTSIGGSNPITFKNTATHSVTLYTYNVYLSVTQSG